jgi:hypothetical protein
MAQQNIDFGTFPNDPNADAIRAAFQKVQENFTELFSGTSSPSSGNSSQVVTSINRTPGAGITVNSPYGNVVVNANISNVQVYTNTLSIGLNSNGGQYATLTNSAQTLFIDLPANISNVNNIAVANGVVANYITANINLSAGNANLGNLVKANFFQGDGSLLTNVGTTTYTAGTGLTLIGNEFSVNASQPNITTVGTLTGLGVNGNITAVNITANTGVFTGNGSGLSAIALANVAGAGNIASINLDGNVSNILTGAGTFVTIPTGGANANYANFAGNVITAAQPNITSVGTLTGLTVGNATSNTTFANGTITTAGNIIAGTGSFSSTIITGLGTGGNISGANVVSANLFTGTLTTSAQPNITSLGNITGLTSTGNITAPYFLGNVVGNISGNIVVPGSTGDVLFNNAGNAGASSNLNYTVANSTLNVIGNVNATNISGNGSRLSSITGANISGTVANATYALNAGNANFSNSATTANTANVANSVTLANVSGAGNIASINLDGNVNNLLTGAGTFVAIPTVSANANYANFAGNAFAVDGANVSGTVANATYATNAGNANIANTAYSVNVSNVANIGNIATVNLDGNVSNLLTGNGTFVAIPTVGASQILDLPAATTLTGNERFEVAQVSTTVVLTATTISALASDNSFNDSGNGFLTAGFAVGDRITASGFASAVNNLDAGVITSVTASKMIIGGIDGDVIVDDAAGPAVTIAKWVSRQVSLREIQNALPQRIGMFATTTPISSEPLVLYCVPNALKFPANFAGSTGAIAMGGANPAALFVMPVFNNATQVGTITVSTSGVFSFATTGGLEQLVAAGDVIRILGPAIPDTTITNLAATLILE